MRRTEQRLLILASLVNLASFLIIDLSARGYFSVIGFVIPLALAGIFFGFHFILVKYRPAADQLLLPAAAILTALGVAMIYRLTGGTGALQQTIWVFISLIAAAVVLIKLPNTRVLLRTPLVFMLAGLLLLAAPFLPVIGATINGATLWLRVGPLSLQPAEFAKVVLIIGFAGYLAKHQSQLTFIQRKILGIELPRAKDILPLLIVWAVSLIILVGQRDLGTSLLFFASAVLLLYITTARSSWLVIGFVLLILGGAAATAIFDHVQQRFNIWLDPFADVAGSGFQVVQAIYGFAAGGIFGTGLGKGNSNLVPYAESDFIFAAIAEELGLVGAAAVILLYGLVITKAIKTAAVGRSAGNSLIASGIAIFMFLQVLITVGGVSGALPITGLTTIFLSAGGSSLVASWILIAILFVLQDQDHALSNITTPLSDDQTRAIKL
jgi:cell division protein FtsW (lipid II flippase)